MAKKPISKPAPPKYLFRGSPSSEPTARWEYTPGGYLAGREAIDEADYLAEKMESKWGCGRLRLLVDGELRNKHDRQRYLFLQAKQVGDLEDVRREAKRMCAAYRALDKAAEAAGHKPAAPEVWELTVPHGVFKGVVIAIVKDERDLVKVKADGRHLLVYSLDEIGRLIAADHFTLSVKETFPGAEVLPVKKPKDPVRPALLDGDEGIPDISAPIDGAIGFDWNEGDSDVPF